MYSFKYVDIEHKFSDDVEIVNEKSATIGTDAALITQGISSCVGVIF